MTTLSAKPTASQREWFTPVWVVPVMIFAAVIVYGAVHGHIPESGVNLVPSTVAP
ncbi:MAG TPA: hypothetical protein VL966_13705 [Alphaproteobacteria bacterium]|jgi:hypothetical protein|nr:hypothetical protein [Alphaproteobacteria bacterium]